MCNTPNNHRPDTYKRVSLSVCWRCVVLLCLAAMSGCLTKQENELVVYSALDREFSQPVLEDVGKDLQMQVRVKYDQESNKTVGLATELIQTKQNPKADIFWNNEILHTIRLERLGLLEPITEADLSRFPQAYRSPTDHWCGFAARARVLIVNTNLIPDPSQRPNSIRDLADPKWSRKCAMARPVFGTSATHAAVILSSLGDKKGMKLLAAMTSNAAIQGGNKQVAQKVAAGQFAFGLTDTDDAMKSRLAAGNSAQLPLASDAAPEQHAGVMGKWLSGEIPIKSETHTETLEPTKLKTMPVDFSAAAESWDQHKQALRELTRE